MRSIIFLTPRFFLFTALLVLLPAAGVRAQRPLPRYTDTLEVRSGDSILTLRRQFIIAGSEAVILGTVPLRRTLDYRLDARYGRIVLAAELRQRLAADSVRAHAAFIRYDALPFSFKPSYRFSELTTIRDSSGKGTLTVLAPSKAFTLDDAFGSRLQKSGSIVRGLTVATNRDLSVNSGFRLQMSGNLTDDLTVLAALTDANTPIQPEGTTQTLQEIDKVFVELQGSRVGATLGDFNLDLAAGEFGRLSRKLQGASGNARVGSPGATGRLTLAGAVTRGKYTSNAFSGTNGVQGPYRLVGRRAERSMIVVAGTERVYVDGELMSRGEIGDYTIDYAASELTFTARRLITSASRIVVDFEYSDRQFSRSLLATAAEASVFQDRLAVKALFVREADDPDAPIDANLTPADRDTLAAIGDDRSRAVRSGATVVGPGRGQYRLVDTVYVEAATGDTIRASIYQFAPGDTVRSVYAVAFSAVAGGAYRQVTSAQYEYAGRGRGRFAPVRLLPVAESNTLADFDIRGRITDELTLTGEAAFTGYDANRLSGIGDDDNSGGAFRGTLRFAPASLSLGGVELGRIDLQVRERFVGKRFVAPDRFNDVEFARKWDLADTAAADEQILEGSLSYLPANAIWVEGGAGRLSREDRFRSDRMTARAALGGGTLPLATYAIEALNTTSGQLDRESRTTRNTARLVDTLGTFRPSLEYRGEVSRIIASSAGSLLPGSFRFHELTPALVADGGGPLTASASLAWRWDDSARGGGSLGPAARGFTQTYGLHVREWHAYSTDLDVTLHDHHPVGGGPANEDTRSVLIRWYSHWTPLERGVETDWLYQVGTERTARLERVFQPVPAGTGNYRYVGDRNGNHVADQEDFDLVRFNGDYVVLLMPTDQLFPVTDVNVGGRLRLNGQRLFAPDAPLSWFSTETSVRIDEKSSDPDAASIYLLHLSKFLNDQTTVSGNSSFTQDLHLFENRPGFSLRFRYAQQRSVTQYAAQLERGYTRERSVRLKWQFLSQIGNQTDVAERVDRLQASALSNRTRDVQSLSLKTDWSYRPQPEFELGMRFGFGEATNAETTLVSLNEQSVRTTYAFAVRGQATAELTREEVVPERGTGAMPYELTGGRRPGQTWLWRVGMDYRVTSFLQASVSYDGRREPSDDAVHTARVEVRAFF